MGSFGSKNYLPQRRNKEFEEDAEDPSQQKAMRTKEYKRPPEVWGRRGRVDWSTLEKMLPKGECPPGRGDRWPLSRAIFASRNKKRTGFAPFHEALPNAEKY